MYAKILSAVAIAALTACAGPANRLDMSPVRSDLSLRAQVGTIMLRDVSLPTYAAADEIAREIAPGIIGTDAEILWADEPERAVTLAMTRHLDAILNATVGPDPWPFVGLPDVAVEVRVAQMLAGADGVFRFAGQYYIGGDGIDFPNRSLSFDITRPLVGEGAGAVAMAQAEAILELSESIARKLAR